MEQFEFSSGPAGDDFEEGEAQSVQQRPPKRQRTISAEDEEEIPTVETGVETGVEEKEEDPFEKRKLIMTINAYFNRLGHRLAGMKNDPAWLEDKTTDDLKNYLKEIEFMLSASGPGSIPAIAIKGGLSIWEKTCTSLDLHVQDLRANLERDKEWLDLQAEIELQCAMWQQQPLHIRVLSKLLYTTYALHTMNTALQQKAKPDKNLVPQDVLNSFKNL